MNVGTDSNADIVLLPGRAAFVPATRTLLVADVHLGKAEYQSGRQIIRLRQQTQTKCRDGVVAPAREQRKKRFPFTISSVPLETIL